MLSCKSLGHDRSTDILHPADPTGKGSLEPTSPRSVEACLRLGIEPSELHFIPMEVFVARFREKDLAEIAYNHHETVRKVGPL